jgi:SAM-dependent methyltransferase
LNNDSRRKYWNKEYVDYWRGRVESTNELSLTDTSVLTDDPTSTDKLYFQVINLLDINNDETVLEVGCGYGRSLLYLSSMAHDVIGVDISSEMIKIAKILTKTAANVTLHVSESEKMSFEDDSVDKIICFAAFDAMYQKEALCEFNRVCKNGGKIIITGKNTNYMEDDSEAIIAEKAARIKGHPNYFTDVRKLIDNISSFGFNLDYYECYLRRGDFANRNISSVFPVKFYEYVVRLIKTKVSLDFRDLPDISSNTSSTYKDFINDELH